MADPRTPNRGYTATELITEAARLGISMVVGQVPKSMHEIAADIARTTKTTVVIDGQSLKIGF